MILPNAFASTHPLALHKLTLLRNRATPSRQFRTLVAELAMILVIEATQDLELHPEPVETPLTGALGAVVREQIGLVPILRAGLGMVNGAWALLPDAPVWHLGLYRDERTLQPVEYYNKLPPQPTVQTCLVLDPMLATGGSAIATVTVLKRWGVPRIKFVGLIAAPEGIRSLHTHFPDVAVHVAAVDERLTTRDDPFPPGFIWPGLGDAGDRQFGTGGV